MAVDAVVAWAILTVSLLNTVWQLWLGLTVLLNAERRRWGVWLAGCALLLGGAFFLSHAAILSQGLDQVRRTIDLWWPLVWVPGIALPLAWYALALWRAGYWEAPGVPAYRRQRPWLAVIVALALLVVALLLATSPSFFSSAGSSPSLAPALGGLPLLAVVYPLFIVLCCVLSLDVLLHPGPATRVMGDLALRRARPWLIAVSAVLLVVSLLVGGMVLWLTLDTRRQPLDTIAGDLALAVAWGDLVVSALVAAATLLVGQAIVAYEIFTGQTLPRRGLRRQWHYAIILGGGYSLVVGLILSLGVPAIYGLLLSTVLVTLFYALFNRHSFVERDRFVRNLRPFVGGLRLYEHLIGKATAAPARLEARAPFQALCADVLGVQLAYLVAVGPLSPLVGSALAYPEGNSSSLPSLAEIIARCDSPQTMCLPLDPVHHGGATWVVPLWSERGLIGLLLLGAKRDGSLYTQEEIEIARATGERLIDSQASAQMAQRLMMLQRRQLAESQVIDGRTRRVLHDEILPRLHAIMLTLSGRLEASDVAGQEVLGQLAEVHRQLAEVLRQMPAVVAPEVTRWGLLGALRLAVEEEMGASFDGVTWEVEAGVERECGAIPAVAAEVLFYAAREAVRNAARHGRGEEPGRLLHLRVEAVWQGGLEIRIEDDGVGMDAGGARRPESGQGLALHGTLMAVIGGTLTTESTPDQRTRVVLSLPAGTWS